jgi:hypothetical protein
MLYQHRVFQKVQTRSVALETAVYFCPSDSELSLGHWPYPPILPCPRSFCENSMRMVKSSMLTKCSSVSSMWGSQTPGWREGKKAEGWSGKKPSSQWGTQKEWLLTSTTGGRTSKPASSQKDRTSKWSREIMEWQEMGTGQGTTQVFTQLKTALAGCQWLTPVILATQEAEIRKIMVQSQSQWIVLQTLSRKGPSQKNSWWSGSRCRPWVQTLVSQKEKTKQKT